jgi:predicted acylesterase/phospholipase RssA
MNRSTRIPGIVFVLSLSVQICLGAEPMRIEKVSPATAAPGEIVDIIGKQFGQTQGKKYVTMTRIVKRKPYGYPAQATFWSDTRISIRVPAGVPSDDYLVVIYDGSPSRYSNNKRLTIGRRGEGPSGPRYSSDDKYERTSAGQRQTVNEEPRLVDQSKIRGDGNQGSAEFRQTKTGSVSRGEMFIEDVVPSIAAPGSTIQIRGRDFGAMRASKILAIRSRDRIQVLKTLSWSDSLIRAQIPRSLEQGKYALLVYYDDSYRRSSNSKTIGLKAAVENKSASSDKYDRASTGERQSIDQEPRPFDQAKVRGSVTDRQIGKSGSGSGDARQMKKTESLSSGGMFIEDVVPVIAIPGSTIEIHGRDFGGTRGNKVVAINSRNSMRVMKPLSWSDRVIHAQIPRDLDEGKYLVLVYYDESYRTSSNSKAIALKAPAEDRSTSFTRPDNSNDKYDRASRQDPRSADNQTSTSRRLPDPDFDTRTRPDGSSYEKPRPRAEDEQQPPPPARRGEGRPGQRVALVLQGGGAYGAFQTGVIEALYNRGFRPSIIVGTSVGALNGAKLAEGYEGVQNDLVDLWMSIQDDGSGSNSIFVKNPRYEAIMRRAERLADSIEPLLWEVGLATLFEPPLTPLGPGIAAAGGLDRYQEVLELVTEADATVSMYSQTPLAQLVMRHLSPERVARSGIRLRLAAMTVDGGVLRYFTEVGDIESEDGQPILRGRRSGPALYLGGAASGEPGKVVRYAKLPPSVGDGVMASSAIPIIFEPWVVQGGEAYWDGAVRESLPLRKAFEMGASDVIGILTGPSARRNVTRARRYSVIIHEVRAIDDIDNGRADFFARLKIGDYNYDRTTQIEDNNHPKPDWRFDLNPVDLRNQDGQVTLDIWDDDSPDENDHCDASPEDGERQIKFRIDPETGYVSGAVEGDAGDKWRVTGAGDGNRVEVVFSVLRQTPASPLGQMIPVDLMPLRRIAQLADQFHAESGVEDLRVLEPIDVFQSIAATAGLVPALQAMHATGEEIAQRSMHATGQEGRALINASDVPRYLILEPPVVVGEITDFDPEIIRVNYNIGLIVGNHARLALLGDTAPTVEEEARIEQEVRSQVLRMLGTEAERWGTAARRGVGVDPWLWKRHEYLTAAQRHLNNLEVMYPKRSRVRP